MIKIWNETPKEPKYFLRFITDKDWKDRASIIIVDKNGVKVDSGTILSFNEKGQIELYAGVNNKAASELGLTLKKNGRITFTTK
jgi:hypothetical protein